MKNISLNFVKHLILFFLAAFFFESVYAQEKVTISGIITDISSGESLIGATISEQKSLKGTTSNEYGFYSLRVDASDSLNLNFSYIGFQTKTLQVYLEKDTTINVELGSSVEVLKEVVVKANTFEEQLNSTEMSVEAISTKEAKLLPVLLGESDILKTIQLKPGIPSGAEGTTGLYVRGGAGDQNLIILDEAIVYNANHLFGFFSTFNTDAVKDLKIYKGGFPARFGGRLSSVVDVKLKEGNNKKFSGSGGLGLISSRLTLEGPIQKGKSSFIVSGRRTYVDVFTRLVNRSQRDNEDFSPIPDYFFYDLNTKINFQLGEKDKLYLSGYFGEDVFAVDEDFFDFDFDWGNATGTLRWNHVFNPKLFANTTFTFSDYRYNIRNKVTGFSFDVGSRIRDTNIKGDFYYSPNNQHTLRFGGNATYHQFSVGRLQAGSDDGEISFSAGQDFDGLEMGVYISDEMEVNDRFKINGGVRISGFNNNSQWYFGVEPRISSKYSINERLTFKASYARMFQYLHLISSAGIALPTDFWYPSTKMVRPQTSDQIALGASYLIGSNLFLTVEGYYKRLENQIEFVDGAELFANDNLEEEFAIGKGEGYGLEMGIEKKEGRLTGWIGYTLAFVQRGEFEPLSENGQFAQEGYFSPFYDRRHDLSVVGIFEINRRLVATATFVYGSGDLRWLPISRFTFQDVAGAEFEAVVPVFGDRNNYRLIPYHRLDLGFIIKFFPKWGESDLTFSVVNAYDRRNAFFVFFEPQFTEAETNEGQIIEIPDRVVAKQQSLFPILPAITWNFKF